MLSLRRVINNHAYISNYLGLSIVSKRDLRAIRKTFRTELPKYRINVGYLPDLTKLVAKEEIDGVKIESLSQLLEAKLDAYKRHFSPRTKTILLEALFNRENDIDSLLKVIDANLETMNSFYVGLSFEVLGDMIRYKPDCKDTVAVSPEFKRLCTKLLYKLRYFEADDILKLIRCIASLGVPEDTLLVQAALQMTRHMINDFTYDELETLSTCLETFQVIDESKKSLLLAIKTAIPMARQNLIDQNQVPLLESTREITQPSAG